ncbi:MAG TPA: ATP-binding cassette domain-containing protein, partial [Anaerolineae bacterium]|nr:ATP-binding cassette domain-containing protein [Anaerolineae bacterium]
MSDVAIDVTGLGKRYRIGSRSLAPRGRWDALRQTAGAPFAYLRQSLREPTEAELLHALRDVSFQVRAGEVLGLIGRNGAGKSTLLKILARITEPSSGRAELHGRVGSLLEVGTGFHPELSGRENIYLNGAILGMRRAEIQRRFDEIVAFSGVERFLDTPVKRYSSGMYVR